MTKARVATLGAILLAVPLVATWEGTVLTTYQDPVNIPTVCAGITDEAMTLRGRFSEPECQALLGAELMRHAVEIDRCLTRPVPPHVAAAVLSLGYNIGTGAICKSTLILQINQGQPPEVYCQQFDRWVYAGGVKLRGLVKRRAAERALCEGRVQ